MFAVYCWSVPRTVVLEDDGLFILASYFNGIAHPPGYPLYTLLGHLATFIPVGSIAFRVHLLTGALGAAAAVVLYFIVLHVLPGRVYAWAAALGYGVSRTFWSQAVIAEVYTLNVLLFLLIFLLCLYQASEPARFSRRRFFLIAFLYGLGLSNHWPLLILSSPALLAVLWPVRRSLARAIPAGIPFVILGLLPYAWLVYRSHGDPFISFYGPIDSWSEFWRMVSRKGYAEVDNESGAGLIDKFRFAQFTLRETGLQLGPVGAALAATGFIAQWRVWRKSLCTGLVLGYLGSTFLLIGLLGFTYDVLHQNIFKVYPVNAYAILSLWMALGLAVAGGYAVRLRFWSVPRGYVWAGLILLLLAPELAWNVPYNYRANDSLAATYGRTILESLDRNAVFITNGDLDTPSMGYLRYIEHVRPDVTLLHSQGLVFSTRLFEPLATGSGEKYRALSEFIRSSQRPVYYTRNVPRIYGNEDYGLYSRVDRKLAADRTELVLDESVIAFLEQVLSGGHLYDSWERMVRHSLITDYCRIAAPFRMEEGKPLPMDRLQRICRGYHGLLALAEILLDRNRGSAAQIGGLLDKAARLRDEAIDRKGYVQLDILRARLLLRQGQTAAARGHLEAAIRAWPSSGNEAYRLLQTGSAPGGAPKGAGKAPAAVP